MSKLTPPLVVLLALLAAIAAGAFLGSQAGGSSSTSLESRAIIPGQDLVPSPNSSTVSAPLAATPIETVPSMLVATTVSPSMVQANPPLTPTSTTPQAEETPVGDGTGI